MSETLEAICILKALNEELVLMEREGERSWLWRFSCKRKQIRAAAGMLVSAAEKIADLSLSKPSGASS